MYIIITASPNSDGMTAACGQAALRGVVSAGGEAELYDLCTENIEACLVCGDGWGSCRSDGVCVIEDNMETLKNKIVESDGFFLITPVYWGQQSERMKYFCDRVRRCEGLKREGSLLSGKPVNLVAAAGGSGNGTVSCLTDMELWARHVGAAPLERIGITRFDREPMLRVIELAGERLVKNPTLSRRPAGS